MSLYTYPLASPFLKQRKFDPSPVVTEGIPAYANSQINKKVRGTEAWREYWDEQVHRCINGYMTAGVWIPGRYYHYLNFCKTSSVKGGGAMYPNYVDYQYEFFLLIEEAKRLRKNIVAPKGRRKGVSVMTVGIVDYGYRFLPNYKAGIAAGKKEYSEDFIKKWKYVDSLMVNEFKTKKLSKNDSDIISGWEEKAEDGSWDKKGTDNNIYVRTMFSDPEVFKGKYLNDVIYEESGEFDNLIKTYQATKPCVMDGDIQYGTQFIYGTGGNVKSGSKGFQQVWYDPDTYNCLRYFISGTKYYIPCVSGSTDGAGNLIEDVPNLLKYEPFQRIGIEDEKRALEKIEEKKAKLLKSPDLTDYWEFCKDNPLDAKDVFRRAASNNFSIEVLNDQAHEILDNDKKYSKYVLVYKMDSNGLPLMPREVEAKPAKEDTDENECVMILDTGKPMHGYRNLYVAGIDSYDQDQSKTSKSLGAMVILRRNNSIHNVNNMEPVLLIRCRPSRKEKFYEMCMKASIYYDLRDNTLFDVRTPAIAVYYQQNDCGRYLAKRPKKFESEKSEQTNIYGFSINNYSKPMMLSLIQTFVLDHGNKIFFPQIIEELLNYDELEDGSDNDSVDALGIALVQDTSLQYGVTDMNEIAKLDAYAYPEYEEDGQGYIHVKGVGSDLLKGMKDPELRALTIAQMQQGAFDRLDDDEDEDEDL
jgi:hypothetical protein